MALHYSALRTVCYVLYVGAVSRFRPTYVNRPHLLFNKLGKLDISYYGNCLKIDVPHSLGVIPIRSAVELHN